MASNRPVRGYTRWYEVDPVLNEAIGDYLNLPLNHQRLLGEIIIQFSEGLLATGRKGYDLVSIGSDRVTGLWKSQAKKREYDKDKTVHKAFNAMYVLSDLDRNSLAKRLKDAINCLQAYGRECKRKNRSEKKEELSQLLHSALNWGVSSGKQYLKEIHLYNPEDEDLFKNKASVESI